TVLTKKKNIRLLELPRVDRTDAYHKLTTVKGGVLVQENDRGEIAEDALTYPTKRKPTDKEMSDLLFAWKAVKHVKSYAVVLALDELTIGVGAGQSICVATSKITIDQATEKSEGAVMASDAFVPMPDSVQVAGIAAVTAVIVPGCSN